jgi:fructokinase
MNAVQVGQVFGAIEAGGTKFLCAIGNIRGEWLERARIPTTDTQTTLAVVLQFFRRATKKYGPLGAIGVGSFGPLQLRHDAPNYGCITDTPKSGWSNTDLLGPLRQEFGVPLGFDSDVNAAALAEVRLGAGRGLNSLVYVTVGTGIGGGIIINDRAVRGLMHPEVGHIRPQRHPQDRSVGVCAFHGDCLEGLASGPAISARSGTSLDQLDSAHVAWEIEADYLGQMCAQIVLMISPERIVLGGGVMNAQRLFGPVRERMRHWLGGYVRDPAVTASDRYVVPPDLGDASGITGALLLALQAATGRSDIDVN